MQCLICNPSSPQYQYISIIPWELHQYWHPLPILDESVPTWDKTIQRICLWKLSEFHFLHLLLFIASEQKSVSRFFLKTANQELRKLFLCVTVMIMPFFSHHPTTILGPRWELQHQKVENFLWKQSCSLITSQYMTGQESTEILWSCLSLVFTSINSYGDGEWPLNYHCTASTSSSFQ